MATALDTVLVDREDSYSSTSTYYRATLADLSKSGTTLRFDVNVTVTLGSSSRCTSGSANTRTIYVYNASGTLLGSKVIKSSGTAWTSGKNYSATVQCTATVASGAGTLSGCYIRIQYSQDSAYNSSGTNSCYWNGQCKYSSGDVGNTFSIAHDASAAGVKFNGNSVSTLKFNGNTVTKLNINGTTIF